MTEPPMYVPPSPPMPPQTAVTFDDLERRAKHAVEALLTTNEQLEAHRVAATSPDGAVTVQVDGRGALIRIGLDEAAMNLHSSELAKTIVNLAQQAAATAVDAMRDAIGDLQVRIAEPD